MPRAAERSGEIGKRNWTFQALTPAIALGVAVVIAAAVVLLLLSGCMLFSGCASQSALEMDYGRSVRNNTAQQVINPAAGQEASPAVGLAPIAGQNLQERYDKSFKDKEPPSTVLQITTGGGGGGK